MMWSGLSNENEIYFSACMNDASMMMVGHVGQRIVNVYWLTGQLSR